MNELNALLKGRMSFATQNGEKAVKHFNKNVGCVKICIFRVRRPPVSKNNINKVFSPLNELSHGISYIPDIKLLRANI